MGSYYSAILTRPDGVVQISFDGMNVLRDLSATLRSVSIQ